MSYRVEWRPEALDLLQREWRMLPAVGKQSVMNALDDIERLLSNDPMALGESRSNELVRVLFQAPLLVAIRIDPRIQVVVVVAAKLVDST